MTSIGNSKLTSLRYNLGQIPFSALFEAPMAAWRDIDVMKEYLKLDYLNLNEDPNDLFCENRDVVRT